jgi:hypothetical protein
MEFAFQIGCDFSKGPLQSMEIRRRETLLPSPTGSAADSPLECLDLACELKNARWRWEEVSVMQIVDKKRLVFGLADPSQVVQSPRIGKRAENGLVHQRFVRGTHSLLPPHCEHLHLKTEEVKFVVVFKRLY